MRAAVASKEVEALALPDASVVVHREADGVAEGRGAREPDDERIAGTRELSASPTAVTLRTSSVRPMSRMTESSPGLSETSVVATWPSNAVESQSKFLTSIRW